MLDKNLIQKNFEKSLLTYEKYDIVQKETAKKLVSMLNKKKYKDILEIGCYTGNLTRLVNENLKFSKYLAIDMVDTSGYIKKINSKIDFQKADIDYFETDKKFDLIIANASLQWSDDFINTIKKLKSYLKKDGTLAITIFSNQNLYEIKEVFNVGLNYPDLRTLASTFSRNSKVVEEKVVLKFKSPIEILKHLKYTGVNSIQENKFSYKELKEKLNILNERFENKITYYPLYIVDYLID